MFKNIDVKELTKTPFEFFNDNWALLAAGEMGKYNMMTVSWGGLGVLWHKNVCTIYVRPSRLTYEYIQNRDIFTLSFFDEGEKDILADMGRKSGRDIDKMNINGLTPFELGKSVAFDEAIMVMECRKLYYQDLAPENFLCDEIGECYPGDSNYHRVYVGEIIQTLVK